MVKQGTVITDTATKDTGEFLETNESSNGKVLKIKWTFNPGGVKPAPHVHLLQDETFEVISGYYTCEYKGEIKRIGLGEKMTFDKAVGHMHYNADDIPCEVIQTFTPALDAEDLLHRLVEVSNEGKIVNGEPPLLEVMVWMRKYKAKTYLAKIPVPVQNSLSYVLAPIGRMLGHGGK